MNVQSEIFCPDSGGRWKVKSRSSEMRAHGMMKLNV